MSEFERVRAAARAGDQPAVEQWYRDYGPALRRIAKRRLKELHLQSVLEPDDVLDSAFGILCVDPSRLDDMDPWQVYAYLEQMIKHKAMSAHRRRTAQKRCRGTTATRLDLNSVAGREAEAVDDVSFQEERHVNHARMTGVERKICIYRADKCSWEAIGKTTWRIRLPKSRKSSEPLRSSVRVVTCAGTAKTLAELRCHRGAPSRLSCCNRRR